jgi:VIT1/CCC1 family predicted Fe2+/Mn2+ transporter
MADSALDSRDHELESAYLYRALAATEHAPRRKLLFSQLAEAAEGQARVWSEKLRSANERERPFAPSLRARVVAMLVRRYGGNALRPALAAMKVRGLSIYSAPSLGEGHARPTSVEDVGKRHRAAASGGNLRAAVFGVNDGLVSNASLILGVSGAALSSHAVLLTGVAGLVAGAFSMAAGEYVSVRSQRELYEAQIALEQRELAEYPEEEAEELALIYRARGLAEDDARALGQRVMSDPAGALDTLAREELGLDPASLASPWGAAFASLFAFAFGAALPLVPFFFSDGERAVMSSVAVTLASLFTIGAALSLFTGRSALWSGARMVLIGGAAALLTWTIGRLVGVRAG